MHHPLRQKVISPVLFLIFLFPFLLQGQSVRFRHYSVDEGFTGTAFKSMAQDSLGYLWISTFGLYKFDGYKFTSYRANPDDSLSLPSNTNARVWIDPSGRLVLGFENLIAFYEDEQDGFLRHKLNLKDQKPTCAWFESINLVWLGTKNQGLLKYDRKKRKETFYDIKSKNHEGETVAINDIKDNGQFLWIATSDGLWQFDKSTKSFYRNLMDGDDHIASTNVIKIFPNKDHYWFWTKDGLIKTDRNLRPIQALTFEAINKKFDQSKLISDRSIISIDQDASGFFWIASQGLGLTKYDPINNELTNFRNDPKIESSLPSDILQDVLVDKNQNIWIASLTKGIASLKKQDLQFYNYLPGISTTDIALVGKQIVVASNGNGLWTCDQPSKSIERWEFKKFTIEPKLNGFENFTKLKKGEKNLWIGTIKAGVIGLPTNSNGLADNRPSFIFRSCESPNCLPEMVVTSQFVEDSKNNLWVGLAGVGLARINTSIEYGTPGSVSLFTRANSSLQDEHVNILLEDGEDIWVGSYRGLDLYHNGMFKNIYKGHVISIQKNKDGNLLLGLENGLAEAKISGSEFQFTKFETVGDVNVNVTIQDRLGRIWLLTTTDGIIYYDRNKEMVIRFKKEDGLPNTRALNAGGAVQTENGIMVFANSEGVVVFDPLSINPSKVKPSPIITQLRINNRTIKSKNNQALDLDYTQNILSLEFSSMDLTAPEKNKYAYQLEGLDPDWVYTDWKNRNATYTNLRPGDYTFKIKATNQDGVWSPYITHLKVKVLPPPWKSWWAYLTYTICVGLLLFAARKNIVRHERLKASLNLAKVEREKEHFELEKIKEVDRLKTAFFTNISHEFRTPLTLIKGPVQELLKKFPDEFTQSKLRLVQRNSELLLKLINQLLDLAKLESGDLKVQTKECDLDLLISAVSSQFVEEAKLKNLVYLVQLPKKEFKVMLDVDKIETVLINLINNAIKFTPHGGQVNVEAQIINHVTMDGLDQTEHLVISIRDSGIGITKDKQAKIFERFYQIDEVHKEVGTGVGLSLVKELVELMNGRVEVESEIGGGSQFKVTLPVKRATSTSTALTMPGKEPTHVNRTDYRPELSYAKPQTKPLVLVVEDNIDMRKFIVESLAKSYQILEAQDGKQGVTCAIDEIPELIISDVMMPQMDGISMTEKLKKDIRTCHIPIILLTAKVTEESKLSGLDSGAVDYITKPFDKYELVLKVRNVISGYEKIRQKNRIEFFSQAPKLNLVSADEKFLVKVRDTIVGRLSDEQLGVESLAEDIGISRAQLYRKITSLTGITVNEMIRNLRLQKAAQLLENKWGTVSEVAYEVGFTNLSYFTKCFKDKFGIIPSEYLANDS